MIASTSNAEDLLEEYGIDYWFACDRTLGSACYAAHVDVAALEKRLLPAAPVARSHPKRVSILIDELNSHLDAAIWPAILRVRTAAAFVSDARASNIFTIIEEIATMISLHAALLRRVTPVANSVAGTSTIQQASLKQRVVRGLALHHALLAAKLKKTVDLSSMLAREAPPGSEELSRAARQLAKETHHLIRISYQAVVPHLFEVDKPTGHRAVRRKPQA